MASIEDLEPGEHFVTVNCGMAGYYACRMWMSDADPGGFVYPEPYDTYPGRFAKHEDARRTAVAMAYLDGLEFFEGKDRGDLVSTGETVSDHLSRVLGDGVVVIELKKEERDGK